jgi:hypothetical protein
MKKIYIIGSLRDQNVPAVAAAFRKRGFDVFDDWFAAGPTADDSWREYEIARGHTYEQALEGRAANHVFSYDKSHLDSSDVVVMVLPCGKSGHLELGYSIGRGKKAYILLNGDYDRWDVMYRFATGVFRDLDALIEKVEGDGLERFAHIEITDDYDNSAPASFDNRELAAANKLQASPAVNAALARFIEAYSGEFPHE